MWETIRNVLIANGITIGVLMLAAAITYYIRTTAIPGDRCPDCQRVMEDPITHECR